jgi:hypothetical protein
MARFGIPGVCGSLVVLCFALGEALASVEFDSTTNLIPTMMTGLFYAAAVAALAVLLEMKHRMLLAECTTSVCASKHTRRTPSLKPFNDERRSASKWPVATSPENRLNKLQKTGSGTALLQ